MKIKNIILLLLLFITINSAVHYVTNLNVKQRIDAAIADNMRALEIHYEILLHTQKITANAAYLSTISKKGVLEIFQEARDASPERKAYLRKKLYKILRDKYHILKTKGVLQYHFVFPNNHVFLRMHKPNKFGDDLSSVRRDFKYVNETHKPIRGFTQGRTAHGFRNIFPILSKKGSI